LLPELSIELCVESGNGLGLATWTGLHDRSRHLGTLSSQFLDEFPDRRLARYLGLDSWASGVRKESTTSRAGGLTRGDLLGVWPRIRRRSR
jgi:hypothetical protein